MKLDVAELECKARELRLDTIRMIAQAGGGHLGGSLSAMDIMTALYFNILRIDPSDPDKRDRDRFILSAGHKAAGIRPRARGSRLFPEGSPRDLQQAREPIRHASRQEQDPGLRRLDGQSRTRPSRRARNGARAQAGRSRQQGLRPPRGWRTARGDELGSGHGGRPAQGFLPRRHRRLQQMLDGRPHRQRGLPRTHRRQVAILRLGHDTDRRKRHGAGAGRPAGSGPDAADAGRGNPSSSSPTR